MEMSRIKTSSHRLYPDLPEPSAPPSSPDDPNSFSSTEISISDDPSSFRLTEISRNKKEMLDQVQHYRVVLKKYKKARKIIHYTVLSLGGITTFLSSGSLAAALTGVGVVVAIPVGTIAAICGAASTGLTFFNKKFEKKIDKHTRIYSLAVAKHDSTWFARAWNTP